MHDLHQASWYTSQLSSRLPKEVFKPVPQRLIGGAVFLAVGVGAVAVIGTYTLPWFVSLALSLVVASCMAGLGFLGHEILHGTVVKTAWLRDLLGAIAFAQFNLGPKLWRKWHNMEHHAHTQDEHVDPDAMGTMEEFYHRPALQFLYRLPAWVRSAITFTSFLGFFSVFSFLMLRRYFKEFKPRDRFWVIVQYVVPAVFWFSLLPWLGPVKWFFAYVLPLMLANFVVICYISTNHQLNPLVPVNDPLANSLTVTVPTWVNVLHLNFAFHVEHHLLPGVNPKWGPVIQQELKQMWPDRYHEMPFHRALATLWRTPRLYMNQTELVDPHRGLAFGSLGNGLDPAKVAPRPLNS